MQRNRYVLKFSLFGLISLVSCGKPSNSGLPNKVTEVASGNTPELQSGVTKKWLALSEYLGLQNSDLSSSQKLKTALSTPPASSASGGTNYSAIRTGIQTDVISSAFETQCAEVVGIRELSDAKKLNSANELVNITGSGKVYVVRYKLKAANASTETSSTPRTALAVLPNAAYATPLPLGVYGHAGDSGLQYAEIAQLIGDFQAQYVWAAPTFAGEPLCQEVKNGSKSCASTEKTIVAASGTPSVFDGDVKDFLGLQNCMAEKLANETTIPELGADFVTAGTAITNPFKDKIKRHVSGNASSSVVTLAAGASRGGRVALLATARSGIMLTDLSYAQDADSSTTSAIATAAQSAGANFYPHYISALGLAFSSTNSVLGTSRLILEAAVKGYALSTAFGTIPTVAYFDDLFSAYRNGTLSLEKTAIEIAKRDLFYMGEYLAPGLQNWSAKLNYGAVRKGNVTLVHTTEDIVAPYDQSYAAAALFKQVNEVVAALPSSATKPAGFVSNLFSFQPASSYYRECTAAEVADGATGKCFTRADTNHGGEPSFLTAKLQNTIPAAVGVTGQSALGNGTAEAVVNQLSQGFSGSATPPAEFTAGIRTIWALLDHYQANGTEILSGEDKDDSSLASMTPGGMFAVWLAHVGFNALNKDAAQ